MKVADIMTTEVIALNEDDDLNLAQMEMSLARIRHLPVTRAGRLVGLVTHRDILGAMCSVIADVDTREQDALLKIIRVSEIMSHDVTTIDPEVDAVKAAKILLDSKFGCLPVVADANQLVGIVTEADFVELAVKILENQHEKLEAYKITGDEESSRVNLVDTEYSRENKEDW